MNEPRPPARVRVRLRALAAAVALFVPLSAAAAGDEPWSESDRVDPFTLADQHGEEHTLDDDVEIVLFSRDMDGGDLLKAAVADVEPGTLDTLHTIYVSDISGMPGLVARMFAIPSMRKRPYAMWLDRDGETTARLPDEEGRATLIRLDERVITRIEHLGSSGAVRAALGLAPAPADTD